MALGGFYCEDFGQVRAEERSNFRLESTKRSFPVAGPAPDRISCRLSETSSDAKMVVREQKKLLAKPSKNTRNRN